MVNGLIETSLRDGNQSLWATRMTTEMMRPILGDMDAAGFDSIEFISSVQMEACVKFLGEDPWERMRVVRRAIRHTPLRMLGISQYFVISSVLPEDVIRLFIRTTGAYVDERWITASMNDASTAEIAIEESLRVGNWTEGGIQFTLSPVHTDEFFLETARALLAQGVQGLVLKDAGGLLTPERVRILVPKLVREAGTKPVRVHSHCITGLGPASNLAALECGARSVWTCARPLANGASLPSTENMLRSLVWRGSPPDMDAECVTRIDDHWSRTAARYGLPMGQPAEFDIRYYDHQMPGGMLSNFRSQLEKIGMIEHFDRVLEEMPRVRAELGYPNVQTPYAQFIGTQALLNVVYGRYEVVPVEVRRYVLGHWGRIPGDLDPDVRDRIAGDSESVVGRPSDRVEPRVAPFRQEHGSSISDEDLLLQLLFMPEQVARMRRGEAESSARPDVTMSGGIAGMMRSLARYPDIRHARIAL